MSTGSDRFIAIGKDLVLFVGGVCGIAYQQITNNVNPYLLLIFALATGIPGITHVISLLRGGMSTALSQSPAPPMQPPSDSQHSSTDKRVQ